MIGPLFLQSVYRELSLLGMISFLIFVVSFSGLLSEEGKRVVEDIHMCIFISSLYYIVFIIYLLVSSSFWILRMRRLERKVRGNYRPTPEALKAELTPWRRFKKWVSLR